LINFVAADETCVGMQRDHSYDFDLPNAVTLNVQNDESCDAEWTIDVNIKTYFSSDRPF